MTPNNFIKNNLDDYLLYSCVTGSHAYGMATPTSDIDVRGVFILPERYVVSPFHKLEQINGEGEDTVYFELRKFMMMLSKQNPNILELLWVDDECVQHETETWKILREHRHELLTKWLGQTFGGYALRQMQKMTSRDKRINDPQPETPPAAKDFMVVQEDNTKNGSFQKDGLPADSDGYQLVRVWKDKYLLYAKDDKRWYDEEGALCWVHRSDSPDFLEKKPALATVVFDRNSYSAARKKWSQYWDWKRQRGGQRADLEDKVGYDTKNASHLIRLLLTGRDALKDGFVTLRRPEADFLLSIRRGEHSYEEVVSLAEKLDIELQEAMRTTALPDNISVPFMEDILLKMHSHHREALLAKENELPSP